MNVIEIARPPGEIIPLYTHGAICGPANVWEFGMGIKKGMKQVGSSHVFCSVASYVRVGDVWYIDEKEKSNVQPTPGSTTVMFDGNNSYIGELGHMTYSAVVTSAMTAVQATLDNQEVIDAGTNDGILAVLALKLGAKKVTAFDYLDNKLQVDRTRKINGIDGRQFEFKKLQLKNAHKMGLQAQIFVANIGPFYEAYLRDLVQTLKEMPYVRVCILGGHIDDPERPELHPQITAKALRKLGFNRYQEFSVDFADVARQIAFVMERD